MRFGGIFSRTFSYAISRFSPRITLGIWFYSTQRRDNVLYLRISTMGDPKVSMVPILDQWIEEGRNVRKNQLQEFIKQLRYRRRFAHALEISFWMTDKRYFDLSTDDVAIRLKLMSKVGGVEQAEKYFSSISSKLKNPFVYTSLLNCYASARSVDKAEALVKSMEELGFAKSVFTYNAMLNLYYKTGNIEKLETLRREMDDNGIRYNDATLSILLCAYAAVPDTERMDKIMEDMENNPIVDLDSSTFCAIASAYRKAGIPDKALEMLKKSEEKISRKKVGSEYCHLIRQYAAVGKKDEVVRLWEVFKRKGKFSNSLYKVMVYSVLKFDDIETAENLLEEWESQDLRFDIGLPNYLIGFYCRRGLLEKAESLVDRIISKQHEPNASTWFYLGLGYVKNGQASKAVEMMKKAMDFSEDSPKWKNSKAFAACVDYLEGRQEKVENLLNLQREEEEEVFSS